VRRDKSMQAVEINAHTVRRADIIAVGGQYLQVVDIVRLHGDARRLHFHSGETLTIHARTSLLALRAPATPRPHAPHPGLLKGRW